MISDFFPIPIYSKKLNLDTKSITNYCLDIKSKTSSVQISNRGGWQSSSLNLKDEAISNLVKSILNAGESYCEAIKYKYPLKISQAWININGYKDYNVPHNHPNSVIAGVYYVEISDRTKGNLVFHHPAHQIIEYDWPPSALEEYNPYNSPLYSLHPESDTLLLFPSWLSHGVEQNLDTVDRISISFNLKSRH